MKAFQFFRILLLPIIWTLSGHCLKATTLDPTPMVPIPEGSFLMGDIKGEGWQDEFPVVEVYLTAYRIGEAEVTWGEWKTIRDWGVANGYQFNDKPKGKADNHPVVAVDWVEAAKWCNAASEKAGLQPVYYVSQYIDTYTDLVNTGVVLKTGDATPYIDYSKNGYRLPTEAEWERAARGLSVNTRYPWGDEISHNEANYYAAPEVFLYDVNQFSGSPSEHAVNDLSLLTSPVRWYDPNDFGLYDVVGNVEEWVGDWLWGYDDYNRSPVNPTGAKHNHSYYDAKSVRGGAYGFRADRCRLAYRTDYGGVSGNDFVGFRIAQGAFLAEASYIEIQIPNETLSEKIFYQETFSVSDLLTAIEGGLNPQLTIPDHWALRTTEGAAVIGTHLEGSPSSLAQLGITHGAVLDFSDTTISATLEDRTSATTSPVQYNVVLSSEGTLEDIKLILFNTVFGPTPPSVWQLNSIDDQQTADPSDDLIISLFDYTDDATKFSKSIASIGLPATPILVLTVPETQPTGPQITINYDAGNQTQTLDNLNTIGDLVTAIFNIFTNLPAMWDVYYGTELIASDYEENSSKALNLPDNAQLELVPYDPNGGGDTPLDFSISYGDQFFDVYGISTVAELVAAVYNQMTSLPSAWDLEYRNIATQQSTLVASHTDGQNTSPLPESIPTQSVLHLVDTSTVDGGGATFTVGFAQYSATVSNIATIGELLSAINNSTLATYLPQNWAVLYSITANDRTYFAFSSGSENDDTLLPQELDVHQIGYLSIMEYVDAGAGNGSQIQLYFNFEAHSILAGFATIGDLIWAIQQTSLGSSLPQEWRLYYFDNNATEITIATQAQTASDTTPVPQALSQVALIHFEDLSGSVNPIGMTLFVSFNPLEAPLELGGLTNRADLVAAVVNSGITSQLPDWQLVYLDENTGEDIFLADFSFINSAETLPASFADGSTIYLRDTGGGGNPTGITLYLLYNGASDPIPLTGLSNIGDLVFSVIESGLTSQLTNWELVYYDSIADADVFLADESYVESADPFPPQVTEGTTIILQSATDPGTGPIGGIELQDVAQQIEYYIELDLAQLTTVGNLTSAITANAASSEPVLTLPSEWVLGIPIFSEAGLTGLTVLDDPNALLADLDIQGGLLFFDLTPFDLTIELPGETSFAIPSVNTLSLVSEVRNEILSNAPTAGYTEITQTFTLYNGATEIPSSPDRPLAFYSVFSAATLQVDPADPLANATPVATDDPNSNAILLQDGNMLFVHKGSDTFAVSEGGRPADYLLYSGGPWEIYNGYIWESSTAVAVEWFEAEQIFYLVIRRDSTTREGPNVTDAIMEGMTTWEIVALDNTGNILWEKGRWLESILNFETTFGQDLNNEDGDDDPTTGIGFDANSLTEVLASGPNGQPVQPDTDDVRAQLDAEDNVYIYDNTGMGAKTVPVTEAFGPARLQYNFNYGLGSNASEVLASRKQDDGSYQLVRRLLDTWQDPNGQSSTNISWEIIDIDATGVITNYMWRDSIINFEAIFGQDIDLDGLIGLNLGSLTTVAVASDGAQLMSDSEGLLYVKSGDILYLIADDNGNPQGFIFEETFPDGFFRQEAIVLEYVAAADEYILVLKFEQGFTGAELGQPGDGIGDIYAGTGGSAGVGGTNDSVNPDGSISISATNYIVHFISLTGSYAVPDWNKQIWAESLASMEVKYGFDLDLDGQVGISAATLTAVTTDTYGFRLLKDDSNGLYIAFLNEAVDPATYENPIPIVDQWGSRPQFDFSYGDQTFSESSISFAVEAEYDENNPESITGYRLAIQRSQSSKFEEESEDNSTTWEIHFIDASGTLQWDQSRYGSITLWEATFNQDMDGDGSIGFNVAALLAVATDPEDVSTVYPKLDNTGAVYVFDPQLTDPMAVVDEWGGSPNFNQSYNWADGSSSSAVYAVEQLSNGNYLLVVKREDTWKDRNQFVTNSNYEGYQLTPDNNGKLVLSWDDIAWYQSLPPMEAAFGVDLDGDEVIGVNFANMSFVPIDTDLQNERLHRADDENPDTVDPLYILEADGETYTPIVDEYGVPATFGASWGNVDIGEGSENAYAVEKLDGGGYRLAVLSTFSIRNGEGAAATTETTTNWLVFTLDDSVAGKAILSWDNSAWLNNIADAEGDFNQDLNGDGVIGSNYTVENLDYLSSDSPEAGSAGESTNAHLLVNPFDDSLFIEYPAGTLTPVTDQQGYGIVLFQKGRWDELDGSVSSYASVPVAVEAQFENDGVTLKQFKLVIRNESTTGLNTKVDWVIHTLSPTGQLDWNLSAWSSSIFPYESIFSQDLNEDGGIGLTNVTLPEVDTDRNGLDAADGNSDFLFRDSGNALYILPAESSTYIAITDSYGGAPSFEWSDTWGNNSSSSTAYAVEGQDDGSFLLAVKRTEQIGTQPARVNWEIHTVSAEGVLDWDATIWTENIGPQEPLFKQDLNEDGALGFQFDSSSLNPIGEADTNGVSLQKDPNGNLYIQLDATTFIPIVDENGNPYGFNYSSDDGNYAYAEAPMAIRQIVDAEGTRYQLLTKISTTFNATTNVEWQVITLDIKGQIRWESAVWTRSIAKYEPDFGWDINGDGATGVDVTLYTAVTTDTVNQRLERDPEGGIIIVDGGTRIPITTFEGGSADLEYSFSWDNGTATTDNVVFAVARQDAGTANDDTDDYYLLARKLVESYSDNSTLTFWETFKISLQGVIDWSSGTWSSGIAKNEADFAQDLNGDGTIGVRQSVLVASTFDTTGAKLKRDTENGLYIDDPTNPNSPVAIVDANGGMPLFDFTDEWSGGSWAAVSHAVQKQGDGSYRLAVKQTETFTDGTATTTSVSWEVYTISAEGVLDWGTVLFNSSIKPYEVLFNQDLDTDGIIGLVTTGLTAIPTDTTGAKLRKNAEGQLFIRLADESLITIVDPAGFQPIFSSSQTFSDGRTLTLEPFAVQAFTYTFPNTTTTETRYKLLLRETATAADGSISYAYEGYTLISDGRILWDTLLRTESAKPWESIIGQDINGNGEIETVGAARNLTDIATDTTGATLQIDEDGILYIRDGVNRLTVKDESGGTPYLSSEEDYGNGSFKRTPFAVARRDNGTPTDSNDDFYLLAVREVDTFGSTTNTVWTISTISIAGILDWDSLQYKLNTEVNETRFGQDLNGDGTISNGVGESSGSLAGLVQSGSTDPEVLSKFGNKAQSDLITITGKDGSNKITFFSEGEQNSSQSNFDVSLGVVQNITDGVQSKMASDAGIEDDIAALTDLLDFTIEISDPNKHGKIHKMTFALPEGATNVTYFKLNTKTGKYFEFTYDPATGEGARIESSDPTQDLNDVLAVYIRDNGKYDEDNRLGFIRDPGSLSETGYSAWRTNNSISDGELDPDSDGVANIIEYLVDNDPNATDMLNISANVQTVTTDNHLMLQLISSRSAEPTGVTVELEGSNDLSTFSVVPHTHSVSDNGDGTYTHTYLQDAPVGDAAYKQFIRLKVTETP